MAERLGPDEQLAGQPLLHEPVQLTGRMAKTPELFERGFVLRSTSRDPCSVGLATPIDELTGLPLPIVPILPPSTSANTSFEDFHHHFHPERDLIYGNDAEIALRRSRGQNLPRWLHEHYHKYFAGPEFPQTREATFATVVLACAGVVPRQAIDFSDTDGEPRIVEIQDETTYTKLTKSVRHEGERTNRSAFFYRAQIGMFFANYVVEQTIEDVISDPVIDEFLETRDDARRKQLGNLMLREGVRLSVEPIKPVHIELKKRGLIGRRQTDLPARIQDFFVRSRRKDYYLALERKWRPLVA